MSQCTMEKDLLVQGQPSQLNQLEAQEATTTSNLQINTGILDIRAQILPRVNSKEDHSGQVEINCDS